MITKQLRNPGDGPYFFYPIRLLFYFGIDSGGGLLFLCEYCVDGFCFGLVSCINVALELLIGILGRV